MQTLEPDEILGDPAIFFGRYFNREPFLRRSALRADPAQILSFADLDTVINSEAIRLPYLDVAKDGKQVPTAAYTEPVVVQGTYVTDRVVPARIASLFRSGATLTFNSLNHHRANLRALAASMTAVFAAQSEVIGFLTDRLSTVDGEAEVTRLIAEGIERAKGTDAFAALADAAAADAIQPDSMLARDGRVRVDVIGYEGDRVRAAIDGAIYALPNTVVEALSAHPDGATCRAGTLLPNSSSDVSTRTARTLARIGVLRPVSRAPVAALPV